MNDAPSRSIDLLYFAWVRERTGCARETVALPPHVATVADLMAWLGARGTGYAEAFAHPASMRAAIDRVHVKPDASVATAHEIAFFPPVTGG